MASKRKRGDGGFWDFVKNPSFRRWLESPERRSDEERLEATDPDAIRHAVAELLVRKPERARLLALGQLGPAAVPVLVEALHDSRVHEHTYGPSLLDGSALEIILGLLDPHGPPDAVAPLAPLVRHVNSRVRKEAALALGNIGSEACIDPLTEALSDKDEYVRSYALIGLRRGIEAGRATPGLLDRLFEPVSQLLYDTESYSVCAGAASALIEIDRERAAGVLCDERVINRSTRYVDQIIEAAVEKGLAIPAERLLRLLDDVRSDTPSYWNSRIRGEALRALARTGDPRAESLIRSAMASGDKDLKELAAKALCILTGVIDPYGVVVRRYDRDGIEGLTVAQKHFLCVSVFRDEVNNGGLAQYFVNSSGDHARDALGGLEAIGAVHAESILRRAMALFGPDGPSSDRDARHEQLAALTDEQDDAMEALTAAFYEDKDGVLLRLLDLACQYPTQFLETDSTPASPGTA